MNTISINAQRTTHNAQRTTHNAQRTTHNAQTRELQNRQCKGTAAKRGISLLLVVGAFFAIGGGQELAADDNADAIIRDGIIHSANGGNFADFRHQYQSRLLFALDGVLARQAEKTIADNFAAVKKADIQLQTTLGNRKGQIAANIIGAFAESQNSAFGWQVRAFGAENDTKGANAGIFFRRLDGESLYGINSFADYEDGKYGDFLRYGIGGELQNRFAAFAINYYLPITDDKGRGATVAFFLPLPQRRSVRFCFRCANGFLSHNGFGAGYLFVMAAMLFFGTARQVVQPPVKVGNAFWQGLAFAIGKSENDIIFHRLFAAFCRCR